MRKKGDKDKAPRIRRCKIDSFNDRITVQCHTELATFYKSLPKIKAQLVRDFIKTIKINDK